MMTSPIKLLAAPVALAVVLGSVAIAAAPAQADAPPFTVVSQTAYAGSNGSAVAANATYGFYGKQGEVAVIDAAGDIVQLIAVPTNPNPFYGVVAGDALLLANNVGDSVTVINAATLTWVQNISTGASSSPWFIGVDGGKAYVLESSSSQVTVLDLSKVLDATQNPVVTTLSGGGLNTPASISFVDSTAYVANRNGSSVSRIDTSPATPVMLAPLAITPSNGSVGSSASNNGYAFIGNFGNNRVNVFNNSNQAETVIPTPINGPQALASCGTEVFVTARNTNQVYVIDALNTPPAVTGGPITVGNTPHDIGAYAGYAYVLNAFGPSVSIIDCFAREVVATVPTGGSIPDGIAFNSSRAFVSYQGGVTVIDIAVLSSPVVPPRVPPGPPLNVQAEPKLDGARVTWQAPSNLGTDGLSLYAVRSWPGGPVCQVSASVTACDVLGLDPNEEYYFTVVPMSTAGWGTPSAPSNVVRPLAPRVPGAPTSVVASGGDQQAIVSWQAPTDPGTSPVIEYRITSSPDGALCTSSGRSCMISGLTNGVSYTFTVEARNDEGWGALSVASNPVTPASPSLTITIERKGRIVSLMGMSVSVAPESPVQVWARVTGSREFLPGSALVTVGPDGTFAWQRRLNPAKSISLYVTSHGVQSNTTVLSGKRANSP